MDLCIYQCIFLFSCSSPLSLLFQYLSGQQEHSIVTIKDDQIIGITASALKIDADKIVKDVTKREIPRFRSDPPGQSVSTAIEGLIKVHICHYCKFESHMMFHS